MNDSITYTRVQAAMRALGLDDLPHIAQVHIDQHMVTVTRNKVEDGMLCVYKQVQDVDHTEHPDVDGSGLTYATVTLVHNNGVRYDFRIEDDSVYVADISAVLVDVDKPFGGNGEAAQWDNTGATTIDLHLYGKGVASQSIEPASGSSVSEPMPAEPEATP